MRGGNFAYGSDVVFGEEVLIHLRNADLLGEGKGMSMGVQASILVDLRCLGLDQHAVNDGMMRKGRRRQTIFIGTFFVLEKVF